MKEFYFYSEKQLHNIIKEMFMGFNIHTISADKIKKNNLINQNILLIMGWALLEGLSKSFFYNNNVIIFYPTNKNFNNKIFFDAKIFTAFEFSIIFIKFFLTKISS